MHIKGKYSWLKHLDFILIDVIVLIISFTVAFYIKFNNCNWIFKNEWKMLLVFMCMINLIITFFNNPYSGIFGRTIREDISREFVLSLYTSEASIITTGEDIINSEPNMLYYYQDNAISRLIISVVLIALVVIFLFIKKRYMNTATNDNTNTSSIGSIIMILSVSLLSVVSDILSTSLGVYFYGNYAVAATSVAKQVFDLNLSSVVIFAFVIIIGIAVFFTRIKRWILAIPTISIIVILGLVALLFSNVLLRDMETPAEIFAKALINFRGLIVSSAVILIAMFY